MKVRNFSLLLSLFAFTGMLAACAETQPAATPSTPKSAYGTQTGGVTACTVDAECADTKTCTLDKCVANACTNTPDPDKPGCCDDASDCNDNKFCTADTCVANLCVHDDSLAADDCCDAASDCSDGVGCTLDTCTIASHSCAFSDDPCGPTLTLTAPAPGTQVQLATNLGEGSVDFAFKVTKFTMGQVRCYRDGNLVGSSASSPFTFSGLTKGVHTLSCVLAQDDGTELTEPDARALVRVVAIAPCDAPADCTDTSACSDQDCQAGKCVYTVNSACCSGSFDCAATEQCLDSGASQAKCSLCALDIDCDDGDTCTTNTCDLTGAKGKCTFTKTNNECCTKADDPCDDGKPCTADSCNTGASLCVHALIEGVCCDASQCDDGDSCTKDECTDAKCAHSADSLKPDCCSVGTNTACNDANVCTIDACDVAKTGYTACSHTADPANPGCCNPPQTVCDDGEPCTQDECVEFQCQFNAIDLCCTVTAECDDSNVCTNDSCNGTANKCVNAPIAGCCNANADCNDGKSCTTDVCDTGAHTCTNTAAANCCDDASECDDGNLCTINACINNQCVFGSNSLLGSCCVNAGDCEDDNSCTTDACTANQCEHTSIGAECIPDPVAPKLLLCPVNQTVAALTTSILPIKAKEVNALKTVTFELLAAPSYVTLPQATWSSTGAVYVSGLTIAPASGNDAGTAPVSIKISNGTLSVQCDFEVTVTATGGYLIWKPSEVPPSGAAALLAAIQKTGVVAQITEDLSLYPDLTVFKAVFVTLGVYGSGTPFHFLNASEVDTLGAYLGQNGRLYIEGGDTWFDQSNGMAGAFGITPLAAVTADVSGKVLGPLVYSDASVTPAVPYQVAYDQTDTLHVYNNDNDVIAAVNQPTNKALLSNGSEVMMVAHDGGGYRTIGSSVMFGGIKSGVDTVDAVMVRILYFFEHGFAAN